MNLDETTIPLNHDGQKGVVSKSLDKDIVLVQKKSLKRGSFTLVTIVCDDPLVQPLLPQMIIGNQYILRLTDLKRLEAMLPKNIIVVRAKSSWITVPLLIIVLEELRRRLDTNHIVKRPVLLMDVCPVHLHAQVWKAAKRLGILLCFVPASLTWLVQPLDVRIFRQLKAWVRREYRNLQIQMGIALIPTLDVLKIWVTAIRKVLQGHAWGRAFDECGYSIDAAPVMSTIRSMFVECAMSNYETTNARPTLNELLHILPTKRKYEFGVLQWGTPVVSNKRAQTIDTPITSPFERSAKSSRFPATSESDPDSRVCGRKKICDRHDVPIAMRTRSHSRIEEHSPGHSSVASALAPGISIPCPSSMSPVSQTMTSPDTHRCRLRARAVPPANKQRF